METKHQSTTKTTHGACAACGASFDGDPIPEAIREHYSPPYRWSRRIALYDRCRDRTVAMRCPDCGHEEARPYG